MPGPLTSQSCEEQIGAGRLQPVYLLTGPDEEQKARLVTLLIETVEADLRPFNVDKFFPADARDDARKQFWTVLQLARTLPMMAPRRIVVVAQAEKLMPIFRQADDEAPEPGPSAPGAKRRRPAAKAAGEAELEALDAYLSNPSPECALVFVAGEKLNRTLKPVKLLEKWAAVVECDPLAGGTGAIAWVKEEAASEGVRIESSAAQLLASLAGSDIARLRTEFERVLLFASGDGIITEAAVREIASAPTTRQEPWAMTNAMEGGDAGLALRELAMKLDAGEKPVMILGQIRYYLEKHPSQARLAKAVDALFRTDLDLKTSRGDPRVLLERLVIELCG